MSAFNEVLLAATASLMPGFNEVLLKATASAMPGFDEVLPTAMPGPGPTLLSMPLPLSISEMMPVRRAGVNVGVSCTLTAEEVHGTRSVPVTEH